VRDRLAQRQARLVVAVVPAKVRLYPEYLEEHRPAPLHASLHGRVHRSLKDAQIVSPDLLTALAVCREYQPVFLRTDTHWTPAGAQCAARIIGSAAQSAGFARGGHVYRTRAGNAQPHRGDLFKFLPLDPYFENWLPAPDSIQVPHTEPAEAATSDPGSGPGQALLADQPAPRVALIGTSYSADERWNFTGALQESLGEDVVNYSDEGQGPFVPMLNYLRGPEIEAAPPGLVIWEIPERYLPMGEDLSGYALPAELSVETSKGDAS
jgi:alginate O-acetyltransferase complex protein AlgJ